MSGTAGKDREQVFGKILNQCFRMITRVLLLWPGDMICPPFREEGVNPVIEDTEFLMGKDHGFNLCRFVFS